MHAALFIARGSSNSSSAAIAYVLYRARTNPESGLPDRFTLEQTPCHGTRALCPDQIAKENDPATRITPRKEESAQVQKSVVSKRTKAKQLAKEKGPQIAKAAVTICMFVFNVVSVCC